MSSFRHELDGVLVSTRSDLSVLPTVVVPPSVTIREMDMVDPHDVSLWLRAHNEAYGHTWTDVEFHAAILEHRHIRVTRTFLADVDGEIAGAASIGRFRRNERIGAGHYLGVAPRAQSQGLGRVLVAYRYRELRDEGVTECESQTHIGRTSALLLHFDCGFRPKWHLDAWNNPDTWSKPIRAVTNVRLFELYRRWSRRARVHR